MLFSSANYAHFRHTGNSELLTNGNIFLKKVAFCIGINKNLTEIKSTASNFSD